MALHAYMQLLKAVQLDARQGRCLGLSQHSAVTRLPGQTCNCSARARALLSVSCLSCAQNHASLPACLVLRAWTESACLQGTVYQSAV